jgi:DNA repair protein NreA
VFVGRFGYPDVNVGILSTEQYDHHDEPLLWSKENYDISKIIDLRSSLINSNFKASITSFKDRLLGMSREISMAKEPVDVEVNLSKKPIFSLSFGQDVTPHGPSIALKKARITENPKIPKQIDKAVSDTDLKAGEALSKLYRSEFDEHYLSKLLSTGSLGIKTQRKLVPTRWSITAVDDTLAKQMISEIKDYTTHELSVFFGGFLGNYYVAILLPEVWSYELFETYVGKSTWHESEDISVMTDHEGYGGRKDYARETAGGYYAARLGVLEYLKRQKRQSTIILLRFITGEYYAPLGVWVVREAVRKTMAGKPLNFDSEELLFRYVRALVKKRFSVDADLLLKKSLLLRRAKTQMKLTSF